MERCCERHLIETFDISRSIGVIRGTVHRHFEKEKNIIVIVTGLGIQGTRSQSLKYIEASLCKIGLCFVCFDFCGQGFSTGNIEDLTPSTALEQLCLVNGYITERKWATNSHIFLLGSSFGGYVSVLYTAQYSGVHAIILKSPVSDYVEVRKKKIGENGVILWQNQGYYDFGNGVINPYRFYEECKTDLYSVARDIKIPCLIVHGDADRVVPVSQSLRLKTEIGENCQIHLIHGADHNYAEQEHKIRLAESITSWLEFELGKNTYESE
jgi:alpha-beta hydrolase superfamily lysophospholipase